MQLPKNTVPADPKFLAPMFPGAGLKAADAEALSSVGAPAEKGKFDQLFNDLAPAPKAAAPTSNDSVPTEGILCTLPFVPTAPVVTPEEASLTEGEGELLSTEGELAESATPSIETPTVAIAGGRGTRGTKGSGRPSTSSVAIDGEGAEAADPGTPSSAPVGLHLPNEHASETAFQVPRFTGLPDSALEHRQAATLPLGLTRRITGNNISVSPEGDLPDAATDSTETVGTESVASEAEPFAPISFGSRPTVWPGASGEHHSTTFSIPGRSQREMGDAAVAPEAVESLVPDLPGAAAPIVDTASELVLPSPEENPPPVTSHFHAHLNQQAESEGEVGDEEKVGDTVLRNVAERLNRVSPKREFPAVAKPTANIADALNRELNAVVKSADKSFLDAENEEVVDVSKRVGTTVAKREADMFTRFLPTSAQPSASDHSGAVVTALENAPDFASKPELVPVEPVSSAHQAVEVVLKTVEQAASQERNSVNLRFAVGDADLSVRVELHSNQVHTTFRTDSPELRAALSREWDAMANLNAGERTMKMVPAFVTASEHSALNSFAGDASSRQRDPRAQQESEERAIRISARSRVATSVSAAVPNLGTSAAAPLTSRRLHTVA